MMTYAEYATERKITKPAVYQYIKKHPKEFKGHIHTNERNTKVLDDEAISILDTNIRKPAYDTQIVVDSQVSNFHNQELLDLEREKNALKDQIIAETTKTREQLFAELRTMFENLPRLEDSQVTDGIAKIEERQTKLEEQNTALLEQNKQLIAMITAIQEKQNAPKHRILRFLNH